MSRSRTLALVGTAALLLVSAAPVLAQDEATTDESMDMEGLTIDVGGVEYAFTGLPTSVPVGTELTFTNNGAEIHEIVLNRVADGVTESFEELMALNESGVDLEAEGYIDTDYGFQMLLAVPGQTAEGSIALDQEGRSATSPAAWRWRSSSNSASTPAPSVRKPIPRPSRPRCRHSWARSWATRHISRRA